MPKLNIKLPPAVLELPEQARKAVLEKLQEALKLPKQIHTISTASDEHNMWARNSNELLAETEDEFYETLAEPYEQVYADLFTALGLPIDSVTMEKAFTNEFDEFDNELEKGKRKKKKQKKKTRIQQIIEDQQKKRDAFLQFLNDGRAWTREQMKQLDALIAKAIPDKVTRENQVTENMVRAGFIGKAGNKLSEENIDHVTTAVQFSSYIPKTVEGATNTGVVLTVKHKEKLDAERQAVEQAQPAPTEGETAEQAQEEVSKPKLGRKPKKQEAPEPPTMPDVDITPSIAKDVDIKILPLTTQERNAVDIAINHAVDKVTEVDERSRSAIKQVVVRAQRERWTAEQLAQELFDLFGDQNRDWRRVAITELSYAMNDAFLAGCKRGDRIVGIGAGNACKYCKQYVIGKEFTVIEDVPDRLDYKTEMNHVWVGKSNYGRRVGEYMPAIPMHPNCRCRWHKLSMFYTTNTEGQIVRKTTAQLINEERARRGLPPDPNLK